MTDPLKSLDRISTLPQDAIDLILSLMPIQDALRTSVLSRKWRGPILEFCIILYVDKNIFSEIDQMILHFSRSNNIKKFTFLICGAFYLLPCSFFSLQGLEHLDLTHCEFELPLMNKGFSRLKSLRLFEVNITNKMLFQFLTNCPLLEEFTWARGYYTNTKLSECEFVELFKCLPLVQVLKISQLYIEHLGAGSNSMPHKLPISLPHLRILVLNVCFLDLSTVLCVISSSPNLEKIKVEMCWDHDEHCLQHTFMNLPDIQEYSGLNLDHLKELEITSFHNHGLEMEFVKLIMGKSHVLKKARIELHYRVSVNEEVKMLRGLVHMPFPRASPAAGFTIKRYNEIDLL
ncbi:unnamed protein product [Lactuca virosa]|uniref:F-box domain-containing protein n=1 Tax=Lactuca virosa TaxID=75947 RepID=A0AAU9M7K2_9ASTR|nr:unnamed protein product [Lactuca virosa]